MITRLFVNSQGARFTARPKVFTNMKERDDYGYDL